MTRTQAEALGIQAYTTNVESPFKVGQVVRFWFVSGEMREIRSDVIRSAFWQHSLVGLFGGQIYPALVLTEHSWIPESDVLEVSDAR